MGIKRGQSLCFFSAKGGVGKTTNIINLAGTIEQIDKKVLIIDMDLYSGGVSTFLNLKVKKSVFNMADDMQNNRYTTIDDYICKATDNIHVLSAPIDPREANKIEPALVERIIKESEFNYDVVLIDTNHSLNDINLITLNTVDSILFVTTNDPLDIKNLKSLIVIFNKLEMNNYKVLLNDSRDPFKTYFSMYDIKKMIKHNIDYRLSNQLFLKDMEKHIMAGDILTSKDKFSRQFPEDYQTYLTIAMDALEGGKHE